MLLLDGVGCCRLHLVLGGTFLCFLWTMEGKWAGDNVALEQELLTVPISALLDESVEVFLDGLAEVT